MNRGEVHWIRFPGRQGRRPAVILTRQAGLKFLTSVTVAPLTTTRRDPQPRTWVAVGPPDGIDRDSWVNADNIQTVSLGQLDGLIAALSGTRMAEVEDALRFALGLRTRT